MPKPRPKSVRWGILGCGLIARRLAQAIAASRTGVLVAAGSRSRAKARAFAAEFNTPHAHGSYEELLANPEVDAVYLAMPHPGHAHWAVCAAAAGKHILCEKPLAMNVAEAEAMIAAARRHRVFFLEAFMYRCHPLTALWLKLLRDGAIGELKAIQCGFGFRKEWWPKRRWLNRELGGGGILDIGCYPLSLARLAAGAAQGRPFAEPEALAGFAQFGKTGVDEHAAALLKFPGGILAELGCGLRVPRDNVARLFGTRGRIELPDPFFCTAGVSLWKTGAAQPKVFPNPAPRADLYAYEVDALAAHCATGEAPSPAMTWADSLGQARALDRWREAVGLVYPADAVAGARPGRSRPRKTSA